VDIKSREGVYQMLVSYRSGDMWSPQVEQGEALKTELDEFINCINTGRKPINDGCAGWRVVKMLEAANQSVSKRGELVYL
jgi:hypothetical protein